MNWRALLWWKPPAMLRQCIINTDDADVAYEGVLWSSRGAWLTFKHVSALRSGADPAKMDGDFVIRRERVAFLQVLP